MNCHEREPIKHTCPLIDKLQTALEQALAMCKISGKESEEELKDLLWRIEYELWGSGDKLEELRSANDKLRTWGIVEAERADQLEEELNQLNDQLHMKR